MMSYLRMSAYWLEHTRLKEQAGGGRGGMREKWGLGGGGRGRRGRFSSNFYDSDITCTYQRRPPLPSLLWLFQMSLWPMFTTEDAAGRVKRGGCGGERRTGPGEPL